MHFDFPIENIKFNFECKGTGQINVECNNNAVDNFTISKDHIKESNLIRISFSKKDPADSNSFAILKTVEINGHDFTEKFKTIPYRVDKIYHDAEIDNNNLYFGYIGEMHFTITHKNDLLTKAAWIIADKEFESVKWPLRGDVYRTKNFDTVYRDAKYMFTGCHPPLTKELVDEIDHMSLKDLKVPLDMPNDRNTIEKWICNSKKIKIKGMEQFDSFVPANGITDCLRNFVSKDNVFMPKKMYFFNGEMLDGMDKTIKDVFTNTITNNANVIFEYPSPWYSTKELNDKIAEAKSLNCYIALDLTWLPIANDNVDLNLDGINEVFFSMNKAWPTQDIRPAFRWSRVKSKDDLDLQMEYCSYTKVNVQVFMKLLKKFNIDYIYDLYKKDADSICTQFNLEKTSVLWFTKHENYQHDPACHISNHYYLDDFVCIRELLAHKNKHFW